MATIGVGDSNWSDISPEMIMRESLFCAAARLRWDCQCAQCNL